MIRLFSSFRRFDMVKLCLLQRVPLTKKAPTRRPHHQGRNDDGEGGPAACTTTPIADDTKIFYWEEGEVSCKLGNFQERFVNHLILLKTPDADFTSRFFSSLRTGLGLSWCSPFTSSSALRLIPNLTTLRRRSVLFGINPVV